MDGYGDSGGAGGRRLAALRLAAQRLAQPLPDAVGVLAHVLALQAQDYPSGLQATALRGREVAVAEVEAALARGELVRTWPMRGTLHLLRPVDLAWLLPISRERATRAAAGRHRQLGLAAGDFERAATIARNRLDGVRASRSELLAAFRAEGVGTEGQRGAHLLVRLAQDGVVVQTTKDVFARFDQAVPAVELGREEALARLALAYVRGHGPVTERDLAWWAGLTLSDARAALASVRDRLEPLEVDGVSYLVAPGLEPAPSGVLLLPAFDEYLLGYTDRSAQLGGHPLERLVPGRNGMFLCSVVVDGRLVGTWARRWRRGRVEVTLGLFCELPRSRWTAVEAAVSRWARAAGVEAELVGAA